MVETAKKMVMHRRTSVLNIVCGILFRIQECLAVECKKNEELGDRPENIYYCDDPAKSSCCEADKEFTCCEPASVTTLREQFTLWGTITVVLLVIVILVVCFKLDISYCSSERTLKDLCLSVCRRKKKKQNAKKSGYRSNSMIVRSGDQEVIVNNVDAPAGRTLHPSPAEIVDFHHHSSTRNCGSGQGYPGGGGEMPLTARGVGLQFERNETYQS